MSGERIAKRKPAAPAHKTGAPHKQAPAPNPGERDKKLSAFYATGPAVPLAAPGPKKQVAVSQPQAQLKPAAVGKAGDRWEREADNTAERVTRGEKAPDVSRMPSGALNAQHKGEGGACNDCKAQRQGDEGGDGEEAQEAGVEASPAKSEAPPAPASPEPRPTTQAKGEDGVEAQKEGDEGGGEEAQEAAAPAAPTPAPTPEKKPPAQANEEEGEAQKQGDEGGGEEAQEAASPAAPTPAPTPEKKPPAQANEEEGEAQKQGDESGGEEAHEAAAPAAPTPAPTPEKKPPAQANEEEGEAQKQGDESGGEEAQEAAAPAGPTPAPTPEKKPPAQAKEEEGEAQKQGDEGRGEEAQEEVQADEKGGEEAQEASAGAARRHDKGLIAARAIRERDAGEPLSPSVRAPIERSLGCDLSDVRVHQSGGAGVAARQMRARAFTHKNHIWLAPGESASNVKLISHEATHTLQQGGVVRRKPAADGERPSSLQSARTMPRTAGTPSPSPGLLRGGEETPREDPPPHAPGGAALAGPGGPPRPAGPPGDAGGAGEALPLRGALALAAPARAGTTAAAPAAKGTAPVPAARVATTPAKGEKRDGEAPVPPRGGKNADGASGKKGAAAAPARGRAELPMLKIPSVAAPASVELPVPIAVAPPVATAGRHAEGRATRYDAFKARATVDDLVARLADAAAEHKDSHRERAAEARSRIAADALQQKLSAFGAVAQTEQEVAASVEGSRAAVAAHAQAVKSRAAAQAVTGWTQVLTATGQQVTSLQKAKQERQAAARLHVTSHQGEARKFGRDEGKRGRLAIAAQSEEALTRGESKASGYDAATPEGRVQANAVRSMAATMSAELMKPAQQIESEAIKQGNTLADGFAGSADITVSGMDEQALVLAGQLSTAAMDQLPVFQKMGAATTQAIDQLVIQVGAQLDTVDVEARRQLAVVRAGLDSQFEQAVTAAHAALDGQLTAIDAATDAIVAHAVGTARGLSRPDPVRVREALRTVDALLARTDEGFDEGLGEMERTAADSFQQAGTAASRQLGQISHSTRSHLAAAVAATVEGFARLFAKQVEEQDNSLKKWKEGLTQAQTEVDGQWAKGVKDVGDKLDKGVKDGKAPITKGVDDSVRENAEALSKLDEKMEEAAEDALYKYEHPIRYKLKRAFWSALKAIGTLIVLVGAFIVGLALLIIGLVTGAIALIVIGLILVAVAIGVAVYGLVTGIISRVKSATSVGEGVWGFFVGILDLTGIPGIIEGITEKDIVNGRQLTLEEAGDRLGGGIVALVTIIIPVAKGMKGKAPKVPLEVAPEVSPRGVPVEPLPRVEPPPVEPPRAQPPTIEPPRVEPPVVETPPVEPPRTTPPTAEPPATQPPRVEPPKVEPPKAEPPKGEPPKGEPPKGEPAKGEPAKGEPAKGEPTKGEPAKAKRETAESAAELEKQLEKDGLTSEEIQGFYGGLHASELSTAAAGRLRTLRSHFTTKDLKALGKYLYEKDLVLDDAAAKALTDGVKPGELSSGLGKAQIGEVLGETKRPPGVSVEEGVLQDPKARAKVTTKPSPGKLIRRFVRGNFAHRFAEFLIGEERLPRPNEAEVVIRLRDGTGDIIRADRIVRGPDRGVLIEIKPRGRSARIGEAQLPGRLEALQREFPRRNGWTGQVVTYRRADLIAWLRREGVPEAEIPALLRAFGFSTTGL